jgi:hypothetical protein
VTPIDLMRVVAGSMDPVEFAYALMATLAGIALIAIALWSATHGTTQGGAAR